MRARQITLAGYAFGLLLGLGLVLMYGAMEVSSTPVFCGTCHVMAPYFESWQTSTHSNIACVDCHIPPGMTAELRKKYEALSMVARYFTGTYGTNPWAEIEDAACLECHERRLLMGREVFGDVLFDHGPHLTELRRGKRLRCTSCHSQIVQGSHITVTQTTCTLCHFKGQVAGEGIATCTLCHEVPDRIVDAGGLSFDHGDVSRFGMDCRACHSPPRPEAGGVPRERCLTCHNDPTRLAEYENGDLLHRTHVSDHKVECTHCHLELEHVSARHLETAQSECSACHEWGHSPQRDLYAGLGGKGVPPMPDVMFRAGVRCEGCHLRHGGRRARTAGEISCMSCHGPGYRTLFHGWRETLERRTSGLRRQYESTLRSIPAASSAVLADGEANLELVELGKGIHNFKYSLALLDAAHRQLNQARQDRGLGALAAPWPPAPYESACFECHAGAESQVNGAFGRSFPHQPHVVGSRMACESCHATHEERQETGVAALKLDAGSCDRCHHRETRAACSDCHGTIFERSYPVELGEFSHQAHVEGMELACDGCHGSGPAYRRSPDPAVCSDCH